ncbi:MAG: hypothetical protein QXL51_04465 [Candidatus Aenigmatarchaeota archaeon]
MAAHKSKYVMSDEEEDMYSLVEEIINICSSAKNKGLDKDSVKVILNMARAIKKDIERITEM